MDTLICLVRHGVTDWNYEGRMQGHLDTPLNAEGIRQAKLVSKRLTREPWDAIYSSTLSRAYITAQTIARPLGLTVTQDPRLIERNMGAAEGTTRLERNRLWPRLPFIEIPGIEPDEQMVARATEALEEIARRHAGQRVVCVAHGAIISTWLRAINTPDGPYTPAPFQRNTAVTPVRFDGKRFIQIGEPDYAHILIDGVEYTGEKARVPVPMLATLVGNAIAPEALEAVITHATAIESAWAGDELVGFTRAFTDGVLHGYIDIAMARPEYEHVLPVMTRRLSLRYPNVAFTRLPDRPLDQVGD